MVDIGGTMEQMVMLFVVACAGFLATKLGYLNNEVKDHLTKLLLNITLPCMILASVEGLDPVAAGARVPWAFGLAAAQFFLLLATGEIACVLLRVPRAERATYRFMTFCTNTGFIGIPVVAAIYGSESVLISSIFVMVLAVFFYSVGLAVTEIAVEDVSRQKGGTSSWRDMVAAIPWRSIVNPTMISGLLSIVVFFAQPPIPSVVWGSLSMIGGVTSPLALMIVGVIMAGIDLRSVIAEVRLYPFIVIKQLIVPAALYAVLTMVGMDELLVGVFTVMCAMPTGSMAPLFLAQLGGDAILGAKGTVLSTVLSFALIPALIAAMSVLG